MKIKKVVAIGGGHGLSLILKSLKVINDIDITAIVTVADDGGSTGRIRKYFNMPAMGDIRNVLLALSDQENNIVNKLMDYRFKGSKEEDILGHNLGNLILTALTDITGSFSDGILTMSEMMDVKGKIIPATDEIITLYAKMEDGTIVKGESNIPNINNRISKVYYEENVKGNQEAVEAILNADLIIYGIGSLYTSIIPNVIIKEIKEALNKTKAYKTYICNVMTQPGETDEYSLEDHVNALFKHGVKIDEVLFPNDEIPFEILKLYYAQSSDKVKKTQNEHSYKLLERPLLTFKENNVRHDIEKLSIVLKELIERL